MSDSDTVKRPAGCLCHLEWGDSDCPVHPTCAECGLPTAPSNQCECRVVVVCAECLTASCWHGEFMCNGSASAGITTRTAAQLDALNREHPDHYSAEKVRRVCG